METKIKVGEVFDGRYELLEILGQGGLGIVFKARQIDLGRVVALKVIQDTRSIDAEFRARFIREAQILNSLSHPNVVTVYSVGLSSDETLYMTMELAIGENLKQRLNRQEQIASHRERGRPTRFSSSGSIPPVQALQIIKSAAEAMNYVHSNGVIHRDIKPENIVLANQPKPDTVKIIDFGLAKDETNSSEAGSLTATGELMGTPEYMSPEQCRGMRATKESDIYSLTVCLFECLAGEAPFSADTGIGVMYKHMNEAVPPLPSHLIEKFDPILDQLVQKGMAKKTEDRYSSMDELATQCAEAIDLIQKQKPGKKPKRSFLPTSKTAIIISSLALFLGVVLISSVIIKQTHDQDSSKNQINQYKVSAPSIIADLKKMLGSGNESGAQSLLDRVTKSKGFAVWSPNEKIDFFSECLNLSKQYGASNLVPGLGLKALKAMQLELKSELLSNEQVSDETLQKSEALCAWLLTTELTSKQWTTVHNITHQRYWHNNHNKAIFNTAYTQKFADSTNFTRLSVESVLKKGGLKDENDWEEVHLALLQLARVSFPIEGRLDLIYQLAKKSEGLEKQITSSEMRRRLIYAEYYQYKHDRKQSDRELQLATNELPKITSEDDRMIYYISLSKIALANSDWKTLKYASTNAISKAENTNNGGEKKGAQVQLEKALRNLGEVAAADKMSDEVIRSASAQTLPETYRNTLNECKLAAQWDSVLKYTTKLQELANTRKFPNYEAYAFALKYLAFEMKNDTSKAEANFAKAKQLYLAHSKEDPSQEILWCLRYLIDYQLRKLQANQADLKKLQLVSTRIVEIARKVNLKEFEFYGHVGLAFSNGLRTKEGSEEVRKANEIVDQLSMETQTWFYAFVIVRACEQKAFDVVTELSNKLIKFATKTNQPELQVFAHTALSIASANKNEAQSHLNTAFEIASTKKEQLKYLSHEFADQLVRDSVFNNHWQELPNRINLLEYYVKKDKNPQLAAYCFAAKWHYLKHQNKAKDAEPERQAAFKSTWDPQTMIKLGLPAPNKGP